MVHYDLVMDETDGTQVTEGKTRGLPLPPNLRHFGLINRFLQIDRKLYIVINLDINIYFDCIKGNRQVENKEPYYNPTVRMVIERIDYSLKSTTIILTNYIIKKVKL